MTLENAVATALLVALVAALLLTVREVAVEVAFRRSRGVAAAEPNRMIRRCNLCQSGWRASPADRPSLLALRLRRRRVRARPATPVRPSWDRCPYCFSRSVRNSRLDQ